MFKKIGKITLIIVSIVLIVASIFIICWSVGKSNYYSNDYFTGIATIVAALIAVIGVSNTIKSSDENKRKELLDNLDSKSEWRKQLYNVASKTFIDTDDVYRVLASLRYFPHEEVDNKKSKRNSDDEYVFKQATRAIYKDLYSIINTHMEEIDKIINNEKCEDVKAPILSFKESEKVRVYTKYLLKHHWEYYNDKKDFAPEKEEIVWQDTEDLIKDIKCKPSTYFEYVTTLEHKNKKQ
ncbi:hypothetical protein MT416_06305 [Mammaliicoccus sciuri]|uniref:hypothetical protein n=1 Tax=Mammaliicoccus sciuri TaxID=1296 RepID=UPI0013306142|nr:hypothetical protein [Mammaliicoccus sciuri]MCJ1748916.1 hypothetical protein [Mammaliicoccus sciuri]